MAHKLKNLLCKYTVDDKRNVGLWYSKLLLVWSGQQTQSFDSRNINPSTTSLHTVSE